MEDTYTDAGQLMCILCKATIRSEAVWSVHLNSKTHKENITLAKKAKVETDTSKTPAHTFKRPTSPSQESSASKKIKGILKNSLTHFTQVASNLPSDFFDNTCKQSNGNIPSNASVTIQRSENDKQLINDKELKNVETEEEKETEKNKDINQPVLPEGFFDDPVLDAKVRPLYRRQYAVHFYRIAYFLWKL